MANKLINEQAVGGSQVERGEGSEPIAPSVEARFGLVTTEVTEAAVADFTERYDRIVDGDLIEGTRLNAEGRKKTREMFDVLIESNQGDLAAMRQQLINEYAAIKTQVTDPAKLLGYRRMFQSLHGLLQAEAIETYARISTPETMVSAVDAQAKPLETFSAKLVRGAQQRRALMEGKEGGYAEYLQIIEVARKEFERRLAVLDRQANAAILETEYVVANAVEESGDGQDQSVEVSSVAADAEPVDGSIPIPVELALEADGEPAVIDEELADPDSKPEAVASIDVHQSRFASFRAGLRGHLPELPKWPQFRRLALTGAVLGLAAFGVAEASAPSPQAVMAAVKSEPKAINITFKPPAPAERLVDDRASEARFVDSVEVEKDDETLSTPDLGEVPKDPKAIEPAEGLQLAKNETEALLIKDPLLWYPVSIDNPLPEDYSKNFANVPLVEFEGDKVAELITNDLASLLNEARSRGFSPKIISGFRSENYQKRNFQIYVDRAKEHSKLDETAAEAVAKTYSAPAGYSEHHLGTAVDIFDGTRIAANEALDWDRAREDYNSGFYLWLRENAQRFGFVLSFPTGSDSVYHAKPGSGYTSAEPWHLRYVGKELAGKIYEMGYLDPNSPIAVNDVLKQEYEAQVTKTQIAKANPSTRKADQLGRVESDKPRRFNNTGPISRAQAKQVPPMKVSFNRN